MTLGEGNWLTISQAAERIGCSASAISQAFYVGKLRADLCPRIGNRRLIPETYLGELSRIINRRVVQAGSFQ